MVHASPVAVAQQLIPQVGGRLDLAERESWIVGKWPARGLNPVDRIEGIQHCFRLLLAHQRWKVFGRMHATAQPPCAADRTRPVGQMLPPGIAAAAGLRASYDGEERGSARYAAEALPLRNYAGQLAK